MRFREALPRVKYLELKGLSENLARCPEKPDDSGAYADDPVAQ